METETKMSVSAAIKEARKRATIYRFGKQWVLSAWNEQMQMWSQGHPRDFSRAQGALREERITIAIELALPEMGVAGRDSLIHDAIDDYGDFEMVVRRVLRRV